MLYNQLRKTAAELGVSEEACDAIISEYKMVELLDRVALAQYTYSEKGIDGLADGATALNKIYEIVKERPHSVLSGYFENYYEKWICLVLETEQGKIYPYTKKDLVMAFRGVDVHGSINKLDEKRKYLSEFLRGAESPDVLFFNAGLMARCLPQNMRKNYLEKDYPMELIKKFKLDMKEIIILTIFAEIFNYTSKTGPLIGSVALLPDISYLQTRNPRKRT